MFTLLNLKVRGVFSRITKKETVSPFRGDSHRLLNNRNVSPSVRSIRACSNQTKERDQRKSKQESIQVGCVPPALYRIGGSLSRGVSVQGRLQVGVSVWEGVSVQGRGSLSRAGGLCPGQGVSVRVTPSRWTETPVKILSCSKLRLRAVMTNIEEKFCSRCCSVWTGFKG